MDELSNMAKASPRLRANFDLRDSPEDLSQRMLNAVEPGTPLPIHRHRNTSETVLCVRGHLRELFYDEEGKNCIKTYDLSPSGPVYVLEIPAGQWHTIEVLESGTIIMEMKDGKYQPMDPIDTIQ